MLGSLTTPIRMPWALSARDVDDSDSPTRIGPDGAPVMDMRGRTYTWGAWGWRSDRWRVRRLTQMAKDYGREPQLRAFVVNRILKPAGVRSEDYRGQAAAILAWVQRNIYYVNEPDELLQSPWWTLRMKLGDCDDMAILLTSMAHSIALGWRLVLGGQSAYGPTRWAPGYEPKPPGFVASHIYADLGWPALDPSTWVAAEPTRPVPLGYDFMTGGQPVAGRSDLGQAPRKRPLGLWVVGRRVFRGLGSSDVVDETAELATAAGGTLWDTVRNAISKLDPTELLSGVISGVIQALVVGILIDRLERRKRNGRRWLPRLRS